MASCINYSEHLKLTPLYTINIPNIRFVHAVEAYITLFHVYLHLVICYIIFKKKHPHKKQYKTSIMVIIVRENECTLKVIHVVGIKSFSHVNKPIPNTIHKIIKLACTCIKLHVCLCLMFSINTMYNIPTSLIQ